MPKFIFKPSDEYSGFRRVKFDGIGRSDSVEGAIKAVIGEVTGISYPKDEDVRGIPVEIFLETPSSPAKPDEMRKVLVGTIRRLNS